MDEHIARDITRSTAAYHQTSHLKRRGVYEASFCKLLVKTKRPKVLLLLYFGRALKPEFNKQVQVLSTIVSVCMYVSVRIAQPTPHPSLV